MMHKQLDDAQYTEFRRSHLRVKGSNNQRELLNAVKSDQSFLALVRGRVQTGEGRDVAILEEKLTENQYKEPTKDTEQEMHQAWRDIPPRVACQTTFWGEVTLRHIEAGRIHAYYLAANGGSMSGGRERIDKALLNNGGDNKNKIDDCVRTIFRRLSGLPEARGNRSVYSNCPFARGWWREHLAHMICETTGAVPEEVIPVFRLSQQYWEEIITLMVSRNSVLGDRKARDVLVWSLSELYKATPTHNIFKSKTLTKLSRLLGVRCAWQELGILEVDELKEIINRGISSL